MKKVKIVFSYLFAIIAVSSLLVIASCSESDDPPAALTLSSLKAGSIDLDGASAAEGVPVDANITATFSEGVDAATATAGNFAIDGIDADVSASGSTVIITPKADLAPGTSYNLSIGSAVKSTAGGIYKGISVSFKTDGKAIVTPPQNDKLVAYWTFDNSTDDFTGTYTTKVEQLSYGQDRGGFNNSAGIFNGDGDIVEIDNSGSIISADMTITAWFKVAVADYDGSRFMFGLGAERGFFNELGGGLGWFKFATTHKVKQPNPGGNEATHGTAWTDPNGDGQAEGQVVFDFNGSISDLIGEKWVQLAMTFDATSSMKTIFIDGQKVMQVNIGDSESWPLIDINVNEDGVADDKQLVKNFSIGWAAGTTSSATGWADYEVDKNNNRTFKGMMDDVRIFSVALSDAEVDQLYNAEK